jgi:hypothetical protein
MIYGIRNKNEVLYSFFAKNRKDAKKEYKRYLKKMIHSNHWKNFVLEDESFNIIQGGMKDERR